MLQWSYTASLKFFMPSRSYSCGLAVTLERKIIRPTYQLLSLRADGGSASDNPVKMSPSFRIFRLKLSVLNVISSCPCHLIIESLVTESSRREWAAAPGTAGRPGDCLPVSVA